jgi:PTS system glucitol/sorbitol-specific IIA component
MPYDIIHIYICYIFIEIRGAVFMKYKSTITSLGEMVPEFLKAGFVIIFNNNAPKEMAEVSILHTIEKFNGEIEIGDVFIIGNRKYIVSDVGYEANKTFKELGHCTLKFDGNCKAELPGQVILTGGDVPNVEIGDIIEIM